MDSKNLDQLKQAISEAGFRILSDDEMKEFIREANAYHGSPEGMTQDALEELKLDYYLANLAKYKFVDGMGEISGFGGGYEKACRVMLDVGLQWMDERPEAKPKFQGFKEVYGIIKEDNEDAKGLSNAVLKAVDDCTGAMHQAVITSVLWIRKNGWDAYIKAMSTKEATHEKQ